MIIGNSKILRLKLIALGLFVVISGMMIGYEFLYHQPALKCEKDGGWWSNEKRGCYAPIYLPNVTGRKVGESRQITWPTVDDPQRTAKAPSKTESSASASASASSNAKP